VIPLDTMPLPHIPDRRMIDPPLRRNAPWVCPPFLYVCGEPERESIRRWQICCNAPAFSLPTWLWCQVRKT